MSVDDIISMSDEELRNRIERLTVEVERIRSRGSCAVEMEYDLCYLVREKEIRIARAEVHRAYVHRLAVEDRDELLREQTLPEYKPEAPPRSWRNAW